MSAFTQSFSESLAHKYITSHAFIILLRRLRFGLYMAFDSFSSLYVCAYEYVPMSVPGLMLW